MLKNRVIAAALAVLLAVIGGALVFAYVADADRRALEGVETVEVLVVQQAIPAGTAAVDLGESVAVVALPALSVAEGAVSDVAQLGDTAAAVELVPGEQVLASRFVVRDEVDGGIPEGTQLLPLGIGGDRLLGGAIAAGDLIGVWASFPESAAGGPSTQLLYDGIFVASVQAAEGDASTDATAVTLAVTAEQARKLIYSIEFGSLYVTKQSADLDDTVLGELNRGGLAE